MAPRRNFHNQVQQDQENSEPDQNHAMEEGTRDAEIHQIGSSSSRSRMRSYSEKYEQTMSESLKLFGPDGDIQDVWSCKGVDCNAVILPAKKKSKPEGVHQSDEGKIKGKPCLSKSQKRKVKQLQEEKEKRALQSKSHKILEQFKIGDDVYSLLQSSGNIAQVETMREKLRRAIQLSRAGLEVPLDVPLFKKRSSLGDSSQRDVEVKSDSIKSNSEQEYRDIDFLQCLKSERDDLKSHRLLDNYLEPTCNSKLSTTNIGSDASLQSPDFADKDAGICVQEDLKNPPFVSGWFDNGGKSIKSQDLEDGRSKLDSHNSSIFADNLMLKPFCDMAPVHLFRPNEVEEKRRDLPIVMMEQEIMEAINEHSAVIICGETGCGKTTQVPQFLYEAGFGSRRGIIGVTQPRRVAVLATAKRVAFEMGLRLGKEVGFQVRHDKRAGDSCSIKFMTDGILLREMQSDFLLKRYTIIILDEAHERTLNTDILIGMLSRVIQVRQNLYEEQHKKVFSGVHVKPENVITPLKLVLMSATLRIEDFSDRRLFHDPPPIIEVPTRQFPVTIHFSKKTELVDYVSQAYKKVMSIHKSLPPGGILVFLTGQREVEFLCRKLRKASLQLSKKSSEGNMDNDPRKVGINSFEIEDPLTRSIYEAFEINEVPEEESQLESSESGTESDQIVDSEDADSVDHKVAEDSGTVLDVLREPESLACLKAAFEALVRNTKTVNHEENPLPPVTPITDRCLEELPNSRKSCIADNLFTGPLSVLPLYSMLPARAQFRVFEEVPEGERLVVVATNVAETSLTIPGIKYVVDSGREKVKNHNCANGMSSYEVQWISKASASQRAGRAGRTGPGHCYRLYSPAVFSNIFSDFSTPEIRKTPVDGVVLLMKFMGIDRVANFPFPTPPESTALEEAERCLKVLEALDRQGRLTPIGKAMARYPMSPRHSRMLLTVIQIMKKWHDCRRANIVLAYTVAAAAALSSDAPFNMQFDVNPENIDNSDCYSKNQISGDHMILDQQMTLRRKKHKAMAKAARARFCNPTSDALTVAYALQLFELAENPSEFCENNSLHLKTMEEMSKLRKQLLQLLFHRSSVSKPEQEFSWSHGSLEDVEHAWRVFHDKNPLLLNEEELLGQAICAGWADRVAKRVRMVSKPSDGKKRSNAIIYQACMVKETVFIHRLSSVAQVSPEFVVYNELIHKKRPYMHGVTCIKSNWLVKCAGSLCTFSAPLQDPKPYYDPLTDRVLCWVSPSFGPHLWELPLHILPIKNDKLRVAVFACALLEGKVLPCLRSVQKFMAAKPADILNARAAGQRRIGDLLNKLMIGSRVVDSRARLRELWNCNAQELNGEILCWFQDKFHDRFEELWEQMHREVLLEAQELFPKRLKKGKR